LRSLGRGAAGHGDDAGDVLAKIGSWDEVTHASSFKTVNV
jgi:hypothetical protein